MSDSFQIVSFKTHCDDRGKLIAIDDTVFNCLQFRRIYYIFGAESGGVTRGHHAHKELEQLIIPMAGSCTLHVDDGKSKEDIELSSPTVGVWIKRPVWREIRDLSRDAVLMVIASEYFDVDDYIHDYDQFISYVKILNAEDET